MDLVSLRLCMRGMHHTASQSTKQRHMATSAEKREQVPCHALRGSLAFFAGVSSSLVGLLQGAHFTSNLLNLLSYTTRHNPCYCRR